MRQIREIWLKLNVKKVSIRLNKAGKAHDNEITTGHKGVLGKQASKRSRGVRGSCEMSWQYYTIDSHTLKDKTLAWAPNANKALTRVPM